MQATHTVGKRASSARLTLSAYQLKRLDEFGCSAMAQTQTRVQVINETPGQHDGRWQLRLQWCRYLYADGTMQYGYRLIWLRPDGSLQAARGQARIPSFQHVKLLFETAKREGWGDSNGDLMS